MKPCPITLKEMVLVVQNQVQTTYEGMEQGSPWCGGVSRLTVWRGLDIGDLQFRNDYAIDVVC